MIDERVPPDLQGTLNFGHWFVAEVRSLRKRHDAGEDIGDDLDWLVTIGPEVIEAVRAAGAAVPKQEADFVVGQAEAMLEALRGIRQLWREGFR